jgi:hypothetical protein
MNFPVLAVKSSVIEWYDSLTGLRTCTKGALKHNGWFSNGGPRIFDAEGMEYRVRSVRNARDTGRKLYRGLFAPKLIEVDLDIEEIAQRSVPEVRDAIVAAVRHDDEVWSAATGSAEPMVKAINSAPTMQELFARIRTYIK